MEQTAEVGLIPDLDLVKLASFAATNNMMELSDMVITRLAEQNEALARTTTEGAIRSVYGDTFEFERLRRLLIKESLRRMTLENSTTDISNYPSAFVTELIRKLLDKEGQPLAVATQTNYIETVCMDCHHLFKQHNTRCDLEFMNAATATESESFKQFVYITQV